MIKTDKNIREIECFIKDFRLHSLVDDKLPHREEFKKLYKQFHALLIWWLFMDKEKKCNEAALIFFRESIADMSAGIFLNFVGPYKAGRFSARSSVENFVRFFLTYHEIGSVERMAARDMFECALGLAGLSADTVDRLGHLRVQYRELSVFLHNTTQEILSLRVAFGDIAKYDDEIFLESLNLFRQACLSMNCVLFFYFHDGIHRVGSENADFIRDTMPKALKKLVNE